MLYPVLMSALPVAPEMAQPLLQTLRAETRILHHRLESRLMVLDRMQNEQAYTRLLTRVWGLYKPLETHLAAAPSLPPYFPPATWKLPLLEKDLSALGCGAGARVTALRCDSLVLLADAARVIGCRYVLEGASLGGQVIARHARLNQVPSAVYDALAFFCSDGDDTGPRWHAFTKAVNTWGEEASLSERESAITAAQATFAVFDAWLCEENIDV